MEMKEFDNALMELSYEFRKSREEAQKVTRSYPDYVRTAGESLEKNMAHADLIVGQLRLMLSGGRISLHNIYMSVQEKDL